MNTLSFFTRATPAEKEQIRKNAKDERIWMQRQEEEEIKAVKKSAIVSKY